MNIAIIGCGGVGKALLELLERQHTLLAEENLHINVKYIIGRGDDISPALTDADLDTAVILNKLKQRKETKLTTEELFTGILHNRLGRVVTQAADIRNGIPISQLREDELERAAEVAKSLDVCITEPMGMDHAQVTAGGIVTDDFNRETLESRLIPGLYACGEVLDIDGDCGGYNLQWAWSSGRLAGFSAGGEKL